MPPAVPPLAQVVGTIQCLRDGELIRNGLPVARQDDGFPLACYVPQVPLDPLWHRSASIWRCFVQRFYACLLVNVEANAAGAAVFTARRWFGADFNITFHPVNGLFPECLTITGPEFSVAVVGATSNFQQLALEAFASIALPTNVGRWGTNLVWFAAAQNLNNLLQADGMIAGTPIMLAGHSYGAAAVLNLAALYRSGSTSRDIRYLTFGHPKPGDDRLHNILASCQGISLCNKDDLVCTLPPNVNLLAPVLAVLGLPFLLNWTRWVSPPTPILQEPDGRLFTNVEPTISTPELLELANDAINNLTFFDIGTHPMKIYQERILKRCPGRACPPAGMLGFQAFPHFPPATGKLAIGYPAPAKPTFPLISGNSDDGVTSLTVGVFQTVDGTLLLAVCSDSMPTVDYNGSPMTMITSSGSGKLLTLWALFGTSSMGTVTISTSTPQDICAIAVPLNGLTENVTDQGLCNPEGTTGVMDAGPCVSPSSANANWSAGWCALISNPPVITGPTPQPPWVHTGFTFCGSGPTYYMLAVCKLDAVNSPQQNGPLFNDYSQSYWACASAMFR